MRNIASRLGAAIGLVAVLAFSSPLAAQTRHGRGRVLRYEAVWIERSQAAMREPARWRKGAWGRPVVVVRVGWAPRFPEWRPLAARPLPWRRAVWMRSAGPI